MRYGIIADNAIEEQILGSPRSPRALFDTFLPLVQARALITAVQTGVFEALRDKPRQIGELADEIGADGETLSLVVRLLCTAGYLTADDQGLVVLTETARCTLLEQSTDSRIAWVGLIDKLWGRFSQLDNVLRTGNGYDLHDELRSAEEWNTYQRAMLENARRTAPYVAELVPVRPGATRLLDIAGSHGLYGGLIARAHPPMRSLVLDLPQAIRHAADLAIAEGLGDIVSYRPGDALSDDLGTGYDVVFMGNILHHFTPPQVASLLARVRQAVNPEGTVAVYDTRQASAADEGIDMVGDAFALFFRLTSSARCYTVSEYSGWISQAGFANVQVHCFPMGTTLVTGQAT
jgi:2-polyprenyl-3-methyl-5-hydroxy-6-metoxy-1,4-benzoquinol methylase